MQADAFLFERSSSPATWSSSSARPTTARCSACASAAPTIRRSSSSPTASTSTRCASAARGRPAPEARAHHPQLPEPGRLHAVAREARPAAGAGRASTTSSIFEDDPYVELRFAGETLPTMLSLDEADQRGLRVVVLQDRLPRHPRRLPRRARRTSSPRSSKLATNTYISPNMVAQSIVNEFCRCGRDRALDRDGEGGAARARGALGDALRARAAGGALRAARGRLLHVGRPARGRRRRRGVHRGRASAASRSSRGRTSCSRAASTRLRLAYSRRDARADRRGRQAPRRGRARARPASPRRPRQRPPSGGMVLRRDLRGAGTFPGT